MKYTRILLLFLLMPTIAFSKPKNIDTNNNLKSNIIIKDRISKCQKNIYIRKEQEFEKFELKDFIILGTLIISAIALILNFTQLRKNIVWKKEEFNWKKEEFNWKKAEFFAKEIDSFFKDEYVQRAILIFDWNSIEIAINDFEKAMFQDSLENKELNFIIFDDNLLERSCRFHLDPNNTNGFTAEESIIRLILDEFLRKLSLLNQFIDEGLINLSSIKPPLEYLVKTICEIEKDPRKNPEILKQFWKYIKLYDNKEVITLFKKFNYNIEDV